MGIPHLTAPSEAEAQCAELVKKGMCYGVGTEDMDALTFGTHVSYIVIDNQHVTPVCTHIHIIKNFLPNPFSDPSVARKILTGLYAKPIGYQYRRFKTVD